MSPANRPAPATGPGERGESGTRQICLNRATATVTVHGDPLRLSPQEFRLLATLIENRGRVITSRSLLDTAWGAVHPGDPSTLTVHIMRLRTKLRTAHLTGDIIRTVRGVGYLFDDADPATRQEPRS